MWVSSWACRAVAAAAVGAFLPPAWVAAACCASSLEGTADETRRRRLVLAMGALVVKGLLEFVEERAVSAGLGR